jgi:hypothetical protein
MRCVVYAEYSLMERVLHANILGMIVRCVGPSSIRRDELIVSAVIGKCAHSFHMVWKLYRSLEQGWR